MKAKRTIRRMLDAGVYPGASRYQWRDIDISLRGKYRPFLHSLFEAAERLGESQAIGIEIAKLPDNLERVRAAINRESMKRDVWVNTSTDKKYFYVELRPEM